MEYLNAKIQLPESGPKRLYYVTHIGYFESILPKDATITYKGEAIFNLFVASINGKEFIVDFDNFHAINNEFVNKGLSYFKFQYSIKKHRMFPNIFSFTKVSFHNWDFFHDLEKNIKYKCNSDMIINMQNPSGAAVERRNFVRKLLVKEYGNLAKVHTVPDQITFWNTINNCLVHVCVPGARNDILDRGQLQAMALGCCTISPILSDYVAWNKPLIPGIHYVSCLPDYSDLIQKIEWCRTNREQCVAIGQNARKLFMETSTPEKLWKWILLNIEK